jgi:hypothetical protein
MVVLQRAIDVVARVVLKHISLQTPILDLHGWAENLSSWAQDFHPPKRRERTNIGVEFQPNAFFVLAIDHNIHDTFIS